jgi:hypothetical protein
LKEGFLRVPPGKLKGVRRELGKLVTHQQMTPRKMAAILGQVRSFLVALPFLRAFTDQMVHFVDLHRQSGGWDHPHPLPKDLVHQIREVKQCLEDWPGRAFVRVRPSRNLHSDSSQVAWAGLDVHNGTLVQDWWRENRALHINVKELRAAVFTVRSLAKRERRWCCLWTTPLLTATSPREVVEKAISTHFCARFCLGCWRTTFVSR